jgi:hypothetical protein
MIENNEDKTPQNNTFGKKHFLEKCGKTILFWKKSMAKNTGVKLGVYYVAIYVAI